MGERKGITMILLVALIYWMLVFAAAFTAALILFTILDWILDR